VVLGVIGAGLVVGAFLRSGRGLIPFALLLSALTWAAVAAPLHQWEAGGFGDIDPTPTTLAQLQPTYQRSAGDITLDLRQLPLRGTGPVATSVSVGAGEVTVLVPADTDVTLNGSAGLGDVSLGGQQVSGPGAKLDVENLGADGVRSGQELVLTLSTGVGDVAVRRG
jgi:predicted membrane protein